MSDLAQKIAGSIADAMGKWALDDSDTRDGDAVELEAIRTALPVAQGEAVSKEPSPEFTEWLLREIPPGTVISSPKWWLPKIWRRATEGLYAAPPASRIAELEREVERLREALTVMLEIHGVTQRYADTHIEIPQSWVDSSEMARKALAAQEKNDE